MGKETINLEVAYASISNFKQVIIPLNLPGGTTILQAIKASGVLSLFPEIEQENLGKSPEDPVEISENPAKTLADCVKTLEGRVGIYGQIKALNTVIKENDRVEIYSFLQADPKEARRKRVKAAKALALKEAISKKTSNSKIAATKTTKAPGKEAGHSSRSDSSD